MKIPFKIVIPLLAVFIVVCGFLLKRENGNLIKSYGRTPVKGEYAPDIALKDPYGKTIKLSELRGKIVLIDFWASWCKPCRLENPHVVSAYKKYKNTKFGKAKGFTIYSVSLDQSMDPWLAAIRKDGLEWENHVSDLKGWNNSAAVAYNVNSIPSNFLIDEKGVIIESNLIGVELEEELHKLMIKE